MRFGVLSAVVVAVTIVWGAPAAAAQQGGAGGRSGADSADSADAIESARAAQARFERTRRARLPRTLGGGGGACGEVVGRFCWRPEETHAEPPAEPDEIASERLGLLIELAGLSARAPRDRWVLAQQVRYRVEAAQVAMLAARRARGRAPLRVAAGAGGATTAAVGGDSSAAANESAAAAADSAVAEHLEAAVLLGRGCREPSDGWCAALLGLALHASGSFAEAEAAFASAAARAGWPHDGGRELRDLVDADARRMLGEGPRDAAVGDRLWRLADPFWALPGNDRRSEHLARQVMARILADARNAFGIPWGGDLRELHLRFGWEVAWERATRSGGAPGGGETVVGHQHDDGFGFVPPGGALAGPAGLEAADLAPDRRPRREAYAPQYLDSLVPATHQLAAFREADGLVVFAAVAAPAGGGPTPVAMASAPPPLASAPASERSARRAGSRVDAAPWAALAFMPWPSEVGGAPGRMAVPRVFPAVADDPAGSPDLAGVPGVVQAGDSAGAGGAPGTEQVVWRARAALPAGEYVVSVESLTPGGLGARARYGIRRAPLADGVLDLSDLLLFAPGPGEAAPARDPGGLAGRGLDGEELVTAREVAGPRQGAAGPAEEPGAWRDDVARRMLAATAVAAGGSIGVAWEVYGLSPAGEEVFLDVSLRRRGGSFLRRAGRWLGLVGPDRPVRVAWTDAALPVGGAFRRRIVLAVPADAEPGEYVLRVVARTAGRTDVVRDRPLTIGDAAR